MTSKIKSSKLKGFTIIEVLIVMAIAGLILAIIFLAVPDLERSAHNNGRKHDAALIATGRQEYDEEDGTSMPSGATGPATDNCGDDNQSFGDFCQYIEGSLSYYTPSDLTVINNGYTLPSTFPTPGVNDIYSESYLTCDSDNSMPTTTGANPYTVAVFFAVETSGGQEEQCLQSSLSP